MSISRKLLTVMLGLIAAVCLAVGLFTLPAFNPSAAENTLSIGGEGDPSYFMIDSDGVFYGLTNEGKSAVGTKMTKIILPATVKSIADADEYSVFGSDIRRYILEVAYDDGCALSKIGKNAFNGCINMTTVNIPRSAENGLTIYENAFANCVNLTTINYYAQKAVVETNMGNPFAINNDNYINPVTVNIGTADFEVNQIPKDLFCRVTRDNVGTDTETTTSIKGHKGIKTVNFVNVKLTGVADCGENAFRDCSSLETITFDNCVIPLINKSAFQDCTSLNVIEGMENIGLETIAENAFYNCSSLFSIKLCEELEKIENNAFAYCTRLIEVINLSDITITAKSTDNGRVAENAFVVHTEDKTDIDDTTCLGFSFIKDTDGKRYLLGYSGDVSSITLPDRYEGNAYYIFEKAFYNETGLTSVTINAGSVIEIGTSAFAGSGLTSITFPHDVITIGSHAFEKCVSLAAVTFDVAGKTPQTKNIYDNAFNGCTKLTSIKLPVTVSNIGNSAFEGCSSLSNVDLTGCDALTVIGSKAFGGCSSLKTITIPKNVSEIQTSAFIDCGSLRTVYLPDPENKNTVYGEGQVFGDFNTDLLLIAASKAQYTNLKANLSTNKLSNYESNLTYEVNVRLNGSGNVDEVVHKLFGKDASYLKQDDGSWESGHGMPTQKGYSRSVWYETNAYKIILTLNGLTDKLNDVSNFSNEDGVDYLTIYAKYIEKPELEKIHDIEYTEGLSLSINDILDQCFSASFTTEERNNFVFSISAHYLTPNDYSEKDELWVWGTSSKITEAGKYSLQIKLNADFGEWETSEDDTFYITPKLIDISSNNLVRWKPADSENSTLLPEIGNEITTLYFYGSPAVPYLNVQSGQTMRDEWGVINSYTIYTGNPISLNLVWKDNISYGVIDTDTYKTYVMRNEEKVELDSNSQSAEGIYYTSVTVKSSNNYKIYVAAENQTIKDLGLVFDGKDGTYTVTKTWYIAVTDSLHLGSDKDSPYGVPTNNGLIGTYLGTVTLPLRPTIMTVRIDGNTYETSANELIRFTLERDGELITKNGPVKLGSPAATTGENFEYYINGSMPAGNYVLTFYIDDLMDPNNTSNVLVLGNHAGSSFAFTIAEASLTDAQIKDVTNSLNKDASSPYDSSVKYQFASTALVGLLNRDVQVANRLGIWSTEEYDSCYTNFEICYSVKEGAKANYADDAPPTTYNPISAYEDGTVASVIPQRLGVYTVYYRISAPNFSTVITGVYEFRITYTLTADDFAVGNFEYTGSSLVTEIKARLDARDLDAFDIYTLADDNATAELLRKTYHNGVRDSYTSTGTHYVYVAIKSGKDYISFDIPDGYFVSPAVTGTVRTYLRVEIKIVASQNSELTHLAVENWEYGEFSWANRPVWDLVFNRNYNTYWFILTSEDGDEYWLYGDNAKNATLEEEGKSDFNKAPAGNYTLTGYAPSESDGIEPFIISIDVTVNKATPKFTTIPYIDGWVYGFEKFTDNLDVVKLLELYPLSGNGKEIENGIVVKYATETEFNKAEPTLHSKLSSLFVNNQLSVGYYYLVLTLDEDYDENFTSWQYGVRFRVIKGQNSWNTTPVMHDWIYGDDNLDGNIIFEPKFGNKSDVKFEYRSTDSLLSGWVSQISSLKEFVNGHLSVGAYEFRATLKGTGDYDDLVFQMTFNVLPRTQNVWKDAPSIKGWVKGGFSTSNLPFATAAVGEVKYTVTDENGKVYELNDDNITSVLSGLSVGTYTLTATVEGTEAYETLTTSVEFSVSEDAVTMTGLMAATIVFAVIAVGLAAAGITLLIIHNKKADADFRRTVRNELRRK